MITNEFTAARKALATAMTDLAEAAGTLPEPPADGQCCDDPQMRVITVGLEQWCKCEFDGGYFATADGWDDLGDMTGPDYIQCMNCDQEFQKPTGLDWI